MKPVEKGSGPLYRYVADDITTRIESGQWHAGDKLPSERLLCEQYQVSQITVRRALRELAHGGRVYSHHGLGWFVSTVPQPSVAMRQALLLLPELDWITAPLLRVLNQELAERNVVLQLCFTGADTQREARLLAQVAVMGVEALLVLVTGQERQLAQHYTSLLGQLDIPIVLLLHDVPSLQRPSATLDEGACMGAVTRHVLDLGHRRVAYAGGDPTFIEGQRQYWGFATTLWEHGLELPLDWVFVGELSSEAIRARFRQVFGSALRPTALVCATDLQAADAMRLLRGLDLACPEDVAVVGIGDRDFAPFLPIPLTSFHLDIEGVARTAAAMVVDLLSGRSAESRTFMGQLVTRESCGARPGRAL